MRRFLILFVVFVIGAALLWHFERERRAESMRDGVGHGGRTEANGPAGVDRQPEAPNGSGPTRPGPGPPDRADSGSKPDPGALTTEAHPDDPKYVPREGESFKILGDIAYYRRPRNEGEPYVSFVAKNAEPVNALSTRYRLEHVTVQCTEPELPRDDDGALRSRIQAETSFIEVPVSELGSPSFQDQTRAELFAVLVEQFQDTPFAPLIIESTRLDADFGQERLWSVGKEPVHFRSRDIRGSGLGLDAYLAQGRFGFESQADVTIEIGHGRVAHLTTPDEGPLLVDDVTPEADPLSDPDADPDADPESDIGPDGASAARDVRVSATNGVHIELRARGSSEGESLDLDRPVVVDAESLVLDMRTVEGADRPELQLAVFRGDVTIVQGRNTYRGQSARIEFDRGEPARVIIEESPSLSYVLEPEDGPEMTLVLTGDGPVTGYLDEPRAAGVDDVPTDDKAADRLRFVFAGPGRIEAVGRGGWMTFANETRGQGLWSRDEGTVLVSGGVRVHSLEGTLESESIAATYHATRDLRVASEGPTRVIARDPESGDEYRFRADGGLAARLVGDGWFVDRAETVYAEAFGATPHRVQAGTLTDVDLAARTFTARGDVNYESLWGKAFAADAMVRGARSVKLVGTRERPVMLDLVPEGTQLQDEAVEIAGVRTGWIRAISLDLSDEIVLAAGGVEAQFETLGGVWGFDTEELDVVRTPTGDGLVEDRDAPTPGVVMISPGEQLHIDARFVREARYDTDRGNAVFQASRIEVDATFAGRDPRAGAAEDPASDQAATLDADRPATLRAFGDVVARLESYGARVETGGAPGIDGERDPGAAFSVAQSWFLESDSAVLERSPRGPELDARTPFNLTANVVKRCLYQGGGRLMDLTAAAIEIDGEFDPERPELAEGVGPSLAGSTLVATGRVDMQYRAAADQPLMRAKGETLTLVDGERGRLDAAKGQRVRASGVMPGDGLPYTLNAITVTFSKDALTAEPARIELSEPVRIQSLAGAAITEIRANSLSATKSEIRFVGDVIAIGAASANLPFEWKSEELILDPAKLRAAVKSPNNTIGPFTPVPRQDETDPGDDGQGGNLQDLSDAIAADGTFSLRLGQDLTLSGRDFATPGGRLTAKDASLIAVSRDISFDAERLEIDVETFLIQAGRGVIRGGGSVGWSIEFAGIESRVVDGEVMFTIIAPRIEFGDDSARADYLAIWVDAALWQASGQHLLGGPKPPPPTAASRELREQPNFLAELLFELQSEKYGGILRALFMEGGVEVARADRRAASGSRLYIDLPRAVAWLRDAELVYPLMSRGKEVPLRVRTDLLETDEGGRLVARGATLTTCDHDVPHFVVGTRIFSLEPRGDGRWRFGARGNRLRFQGGFQIPLPSIGNLVLDEDFGIEGFENEAGEVTPLRDIGIARTARFGTVLGAAFRFDVGDVGRWVAERIGMDANKLRGKWDTEAQYLGSRGPLVGLGLKLREREPGDAFDEDFRLDAFVSGIPDDGEDRGTVRVDQSDRGGMRVWGYVRSRYPIVRGEWLDVAVASQTDAGVQAEFYENEFLAFEQRDTFVRWRKSFGADYLAAGAQKRIDDYRSQREELPSFSAYRGERAIGNFTGSPVLWGGALDVGYFTRREGEIGKDLFSDLPGGAEAAIGDAETARGDLVQRLSLPVSTQLAGIKATPFAEIRGTAWTSALDDGDAPVRGAVRTGAELSTTLHKVTRNGYLHALAPRLLVSTDVWYDDDGGALIPLDRTEDPIDGLHYEAGLRGLWQRPATFENLDVDVRAIVRQDRENGVVDSTQIATLGEYITRYGNGKGLVGIRHDARYDVESSETTFTRSAVAVRPNDAFLVEFRYGQARAIDAVELFETGGILSRWRVDPKWELEANYTHDLRNDQQLFTEFTLRRFSHDFVFDITFQDRSGEGGTNVSFSLAPLLGWTRSRLGMLDR